jgi:hypothetical protein
MGVESGRITRGDRRQKNYLRHRLCQEKLLGKTTCGFGLKNYFKKLLQKKRIGPAASGKNEFLHEAKEKTNCLSFPPHKILDRVPFQAITRFQLAIYRLSLLGASSEKLLQYPRIPRLRERDKSLDLDVDTRDPVPLENGDTGDLEV